MECESSWKPRSQVEWVEEAFCNAPVNTFMDHYPVRCTSKAKHNDTQAGMEIQASDQMHEFVLHVSKNVLDFLSSQSSEDISQFYAVTSTSILLKKFKLVPQLDRPLGLATMSVYAELFDVGIDSHGNNVARTMVCDVPKVQSRIKALWLDFHNTDNLIVPGVSRVALRDVAECTISDTEMLWNCFADCILEAATPGQDSQINTVANSMHFDNDFNSALDNLQVNDNECTQRSNHSELVDTTSVNRLCAFESPLEQQTTSSGEVQCVMTTSTDSLLAAINKEPSTEEAGASGPNDVAMVNGDHVDRRSSPCISIQKLVARAALPIQLCSESSGEVQRITIASSDSLLAAINKENASNETDQASSERWTCASLSHDRQLHGLMMADDDCLVAEMTSSGSDATLIRTGYDAVQNDIVIRHQSMQLNHNEPADVNMVNLDRADRASASRMEVIPDAVSPVKQYMTSSGEIQKLMTTSSDSLLAAIDKEPSVDRAGAPSQIYSPASCARHLHDLIEDDTSAVEITRSDNSAALASIRCLTEEDDAMRHENHSRKRCHEESSSSRQGVNQDSSNSGTKNRCNCVMQPSGSSCLTTEGSSQSQEGLCDSDTCDEDRRRNLSLYPSDRVQRYTIAYWEDKARLLDVDKET